MEQFFNWPATGIALGLSIVVAVVLVGFAVFGLRVPILVKLGARNIARRRLRAALIVFGLMLSTTVIGSAFGTGDTITHTLRSLVAGSLGSVDEVVVLNPPRTHLGQKLRALVEPGFGGLAAANLDFFSENELDRLKAAADRSEVIAGIAPAIIDQVSVVHPANQQLRSALALLAIPAPYPTAFGALESSDGDAVTLESLPMDAVVLNTAAAEALGAVAGQPLVILHHGRTWNVRIHAVTENGGLAGMQPLLIAPLRHYQRITQREGQINQLLVVNRGGTASVTHSAAATRELRDLLINRAVAQELHTLLARPDVQRGLREAEETLQGRERARLAALRSEAARPEMTQEFVSLISEPRTRQRLFSLAWRLSSGSERHSAYQLLQDVASLSVLEVKQEALDQAEEFGAVITTVFLVLSIFSIAASILLIFLIFALLAADRVAELATMRALGMRRRQIMGMFLFEGLVYNLLGAALGTSVSLITGYLIVGVLRHVLEPFGVRLAPHIDPNSLLIAFSGGVLLTLGTMLLAAWRVSHVQIVAATHGEEIGEDGVWHLVMGIVLLLAAGVVWWRWHSPPNVYAPRHPLVLPSTLSLALLGVTCCLLWLQRRVVWLRQAIAGGRVALVGVVLIGVWLRTLVDLPAPRHGTTADVVTLAVGGLILILAAVWTGVYGLRPLLGVVELGLSGLTWVRAVIRPAAGYLRQERWRTGLTTGMFSMVVFVMVVALTLIHVILNAYASGEPPVGGYELRADLRSSASIPDIEQALSEAPSVSRAAFGAIGGVTRLEVQSVQLGLPRASWQDSTLAVVDDGFLSGIQASIEQRVSAYDSDRAVWAALREHPGTAVVTKRWLHNIVSDASISQRGMLQPFTVWVRPLHGGRPIRLTIVGIVSARSELEPGIYTTRATATGLGIRLAAPGTYFFAVRPGVRVKDAADGLRISFADRGVSVTNLGDMLRISQAVRLLLTRLVQSFMGLGLIAGIAALGILGVQAVVERQQQLGTLRALGFTRRHIHAMLAFETAVIAALGIGLGLLLGLVVARSVVALLVGNYPEVRFAVPWPEILLMITIAWLGSNLAILLAAWQAGRVSPAAALRSM